jgi:cobalt-zinc-cadmium efflux system membrane fusion protein
MSLEAQAAAGVKVVTISAESVPEVVRATAKLTNDENHTWRVGAVAEGRIMRVQANPGDVVKKDQLLAQMHSHDIHESRAAYKKAKADHARLVGVEEYRLKLKDRAKRLLDLRAGSVAQYEQAETEWKNSQTDVHNAEIEIEKTKTHLEEVLGIPAEETDIPKDPSGEDNDLIPILAPSAGVVLTRSITPGTVVTPSTDLFTVSDLSSLWAMAEVSEEYLGKLRVGMPVRVYVQAYPSQAFLGRIGKLGELLDPGTRTIKVRIELRNMQGKLKPEMYADAEIELGRGGTALMLPADAVQDLRGEPVVFVKTGDDKFDMRPIQTGRTIGTNIEVTSGLRAGDAVVTQSAFILKSEFLKASISQE